MKYLQGIFATVSLACIIGLCGCTETLHTLENDSYRVTVTRLNPSAFDDFVLNVYVTSNRGLWSLRTKLLELEGGSDIEAEFADSNLLLLKSWFKEDYSVFLEHYLMRIPMKCISTIAYDFNSPDDPLIGDTIPYERKSLGWRIVSFHRVHVSEKAIMVMLDTDQSKSIFSRSVLIAPVDTLVGEILSEDTLRLSITWCGDGKTQDVLVKMPTSKEEDLEYIIK